ncbi:MAG: sigma-70 family RNA polymerase sigma factor [Planctomycetota bacterium]|nr:sigma-70 family RNA polymerase sigma factor [Planctomycetota bacterium]MCX8039347.1 sigma-70 family RNA polymerase sigma factor [Planctomycetota bacterium]MDW8373638.1 sigma-70 family RNA polymerase sigma factor [Planctomycetota bacterium]
MAFGPAVSEQGAERADEAAEDLALMARVRDGDREALVAIVRRYQDELIGFFYHLCGDQLRSEELAQDVFVRVYAARTRWQPTARLRTWLYRIAHNLWIDQLRRQRPLLSLDAERASDGQRWHEVLAAAPAREAPDEEHRRYLRQRVQAALAALPAGQREVFVLACDQGLPYRDIAEILGIPEGTVKSRMHHAVRALRDRLADLLEDEA